MTPQKVLYVSTRASSVCIISIQHGCTFVIVQFIYTCCFVVICGGETPSIFLFLNDLLSNRQHELPGEQLVCIPIRLGNHLSELVTAFLILLLTGSVLLLLLLLLWISHFYICSIWIKCLHAPKTDIHGGYAQHSMYRPTMVLTVFAGLVEKQIELHHVSVCISKF